MCAHLRLGSACACTQSFLSAWNALDPWLKPQSALKIFWWDYMYAQSHLSSLDAHITKTRLYNFDPLKLHFYMVKLGSTLFSYFCSIKHRLWVLVRTDKKYVKYRIFLSENFHFLVVKFSVYLNRYVFVTRQFCRKCCTPAQKFRYSVYSV